MTRARFSHLVEETLRTLPRRFRDALHNIAVIIEDEPPSYVLEDLGMEPDDTLFGLYEGTPLPERGAGYGNVLPDRISIYQRPIELACAPEGLETDGAFEEDATFEEDIRICVAETVIHEFGHYFGLSEEEIQEIEDNYWQGDTTDEK